MNWTYIKKETVFKPRPTFECTKCGQKEATRTFVAVDEQRECLFEQCASCGHERTLPVGDSKSNYDLPTVGEAKQSLKQDKK